MNFIGHWWIIGLLVVVLIIFGPGKLPQIGGAVGTAIKEFRKATSELKDEVSKATTTEPQQPEPPTIIAGGPHPPPPLADSTHKGTAEAPKS